MTSNERGALVLVRFIFADERGAKRRPVLVLSTDEYHSGRQQLIVAAVTSNVARILPGDVVLKDWHTSGLPKPSLATGIVRTIKRDMIETEIGRASATDLYQVEQSLRRVLGL